MEQIFLDASSLHQERELDRASALYKQVLEVQPNHGGAWYALGVIAYQTGHSGRAVELMGRAISGKPDWAEAHNNCGVVCYQLGQFDAALRGYDQAIAIKQDYAQAHCNRGYALVALKRPDEAARSYERAIALNPSHVEAYSGRGGALQAFGQFDAAAECLARAIALAPDHAVAHGNLGNVFRKLGRFEDAEASYRRALQLAPGDAVMQCNLGNALRELGRAGEAEICYRRALQIDSGDAVAHGNLGDALRELGQVERAVASYRDALLIQPDDTEAHFKLGIALRDLDRFEEAEAIFRKALQIRPDDPAGLNNLGLALTDLGRLEEALASYRRALEIAPDFSAVHSNLLFVANFLPDRPDAASLEEARSYGERAARRARPYVKWANVRDANRCVRVGLLSADLRDHPVGFFIEGMLAALAAHAFGRLEVVAYATTSVSDAVTRRIQTYCHGWHVTVGRSDEEVARQIHGDGIDILIDLNGHTAHNRLPVLAWKPVPVQASWLGYFPTTGMSEVDYLIADRWVPPPAGEAYFTETIWRLPETYACFTPPIEDIAVGMLPALAAGHITFGCFNNLIKMNDAVVALWARVLQAVPESRLFLKTKQLTSASMQEKVMERFKLHGIAAGRLILEGHAPHAELLAAYRRVDIALDPFPFPGGTSSVEALWMGVPVLALVGERFVSHIGESILQNAGLPDWIAVSDEDYVAKAAAHAGDRQALAALREGLRQQVLASPLFDARRFAVHFEAALREMWRTWCMRQESKDAWFPLAWLRGLFK